MFKQSTKPSVFWAYCDLASLIDDFIYTDDIKSETIQTQIEDAGKRPMQFKWWVRDYRIHIYLQNVQSMK